MIFPPKKFPPPFIPANHFSIFHPGKMSQFIEDLMDGPDLVSIFDDDDERYMSSLMTAPDNGKEVAVTIHDKVDERVADEILSCIDDMHKQVLADPVTASFFTTANVEGVKKRLRDLYFSDVGPEGFPRGFHGMFFCRSCNKFLGWHNQLKLFCGSLECNKQHYHHQYLCDRPNGRRWFLPCMLSSGFEDPPHKAIILDGDNKPILKCLYVQHNGEIKRVNFKTD
jgi:hypothetical protein